MAIYHLSARIISRGKGRSCVAAAAYCSGSCLLNEYDGALHNFTRKSGVIFSQIMLPENAPSEYSSRTLLWNSVEKVEKNKNSQLARELEIALPVEVERAKQIEMLQNYVQENFVSKGMIADFSLHDKKDGNPHVHIMLTVRPLEQDGTWRKTKSKKIYRLDENGQKKQLKNGEYSANNISATDWNTVESLKRWRANWATLCNEELEKIGVEKIDHRSLKEQGVQLQPTIHLGTTANQLEQKGMQTERGNTNRRIEKRNSLLKLRERAISSVHKTVERLEQEVKASQAVDLQPGQKESVIESIRLIHATEDTDKQWQKIRNLQDAAKTVNFLEEHQVLENNALDEKIEAMRQECSQITGQVKLIDVQIQGISSTIKNLETYYRTKPIVQKQKNVIMKEKYKQEHISDFILYGAAKKELEKLNISKFPQLKDLRLELAELKKTRQEFTQKYQEKKKEMQSYSNAKANIDVLLQRPAEKSQSKEKV